MDEPKSLSDKLLAAMGAAVELRVVTYVGDAPISGTLAKPKVDFGSDAKPGNALATSINLVEGDITSVIPDKFWAADKQVIRDFHQAQVEQAKDIVARNLGLVADLGQRVIEAAADLRRIEAQRGQPEQP